jgi:tetratricopeptide (TPR) repeat protein
MVKYIGILLLFVSCSGSKKMLKKGTALENANQYNAASDYYFEALDRKKTNVDATIALKRVGSKVLNNYLNEFYKEESFGNPKKAVYSYLEAEKFQKKLSKYTIFEEIPSHYTEKYNTIKESYLISLYEEGAKFIEEENYTAAEVNFIEILKFDPKYKDVKDLRDFSYVEPKYIEAKNQLESENYRAAYNSFDLVLKRIPNYKDAKEAKEEALELGMHTFLLFSFENTTQKKHIESKISSYVSNNLSNLNDPFLRLVDRKNYEKIMQEQELALSGIVDEGSAAEIGKLFGAQTAIAGKVFNYSYKLSSLQTQKKEAYAAYTVDKKDPETGKIIKQTRYKKVYYMNYSQNLEVYLGFQFKVISLETSEVLVSDIVELSTKDYVSYSNYSGNSSILYPSSGANVITNRSSVNRLRSEFSARKNLKSEQELSNDLSKRISNEVAHKVEKYLY